MDDLLQMGKRILASQPFSVLLGADLTGFSPGAAEITVPIQPQFLQQHGYAHGGLISYAADNALTFAGGSVLGTSVLTAEYQIDYLRPAGGEALVARAAVVHAGRSRAVCRCDVFALAGGKETLCAVAQGTIVKTGRESE